MIRNRFPESSLILSSSSRSPLLSLTEISCPDIILSVTLAGDTVTLGTEHSAVWRQNLFSSFVIWIFPPSPCMLIDHQEAWWEIFVVDIMKRNKHPSNSMYIRSSLINNLCVWMEEHNTAWLSNVSDFRSLLKKVLSQSMMFTALRKVLESEIFVCGCLCLSRLVPLIIMMLILLLS